MLDLLLKYSARDDDCKALSVAMEDDHLVSRLLSLKANQDAENIVNKKGIAEFNHSIIKVRAHDVKFHRALYSNCDNFRDSPPLDR